MGKLYDKIVKKLIKEKLFVWYVDGNGFYFMILKCGDVYWMLCYIILVIKFWREYIIGKVDDWLLVDVCDEVAKLRLVIKCEGIDLV